MAAMMCVESLGFSLDELTRPGSQRSTCKMKNGVLMGQEKESSWCLRVRFLVRMQWAHSVHHLWMSVVIRGQKKRLRMRCKVLYGPR